MKQLLQDLSNGNTFIIEAPAPEATPGSVVIATSLSLVSAGTERMLVEFGKASLVEKARQQPEKVKMVLEKFRKDGLMVTVDAVRSKLQQPIPLGNSSVGVVVNVGAGVGDIVVGDRVVSNGYHADMVKVGKNLCCRIPDNVSDESAVFTVITSIALEGIRLAQPTLGESVVVTGVGLIGLLTVQLLLAMGCRVLAVDINEKKLELARQFGAEICNGENGADCVSAGMAFSKGKGIDAVIITASTRSNDPVQQAARMCRIRGRIILVGVTGLQLNRADFYEKELMFQVSCSYGPGRYDPEYEDKGHDYPIGHVRWTEQRNFEAVLELMSKGKIDTDSLITHRFLFEEAPIAYKTLVADKSVMGMLLKYNSDIEQRKVENVSLSKGVEIAGDKPVVGFIGAGNYASRVLIPNFKNADVQLHTIITSGSVNGVVHGKKAGFIEASSDVDTMLRNGAINSVVIATRHDSHSKLIVKALEAGKHVFVEKPLCLTLEQLVDIEAACSTSKSMLMVGFNRRFSPHARAMKDLLKGVSEPKAFVMTVNAGAIAADHWTQDSEVGGGRIIGEACHFVDLLLFLAGN